MASRRMGAIAMGAPGIGRFHLHERLWRALRQRGHAVTMLCLQRTDHTFWRHQLEGPVELPPPAAAGAPDAALLDLARRHAPGRREHRRLQRLLPRVHAWFAARRPELLLLHQDRTADTALLQYVARAHGCRVVWTGEGMLPHTLQLDETGLDGDASWCRRAAGDFRVVQAEPALLESCLAAALAHTTPVALPRRPPVVPPLGERLLAAGSQLLREGLAPAIASIGAWRAALPAVDHPGTENRATVHGAAGDWVAGDWVAGDWVAGDWVAGDWVAPDRPFVAVLLQSPEDARLWLDAADPPTAASLVRATAAAAAALDPALAVVAIAPEGRPAAAAVRRAVLAVAGTAAAPAVLATAAAVVTVNHPLASVALLAGTPVVHFGRSLYGVRGVATQATLAGLPAALAAAVARDHATLRARFLTWVLRHGHVWCSATHPDHNGVLGLVQALEARLRSPSAMLPALQYRTGPAWPLAGEQRPR